MDLIERLLNDVLSITNSYKELQDREKRVSNDLSLAQAQLFPLRKENARLSRENHQLHIDAVRLGDENASLSSEQSLVTNRIRDELTEAKLLLNMKEEIIAKKNQDIERLRDVSSYVLTLYYCCLFFTYISLKGL